ncbi:MAG: DUF309 domain-containing protein [Mycolicibacterium insubricum]
MTDRTAGADDAPRRPVRSRDALGRPLPPGQPGVAQLPDDLRLTPQETLTKAQELLDDGLAFYAHEVFEARWKNCPDQERELWQGLAQLAVGITHIQRGNPTGAASLLRRSAARLRATGDAPYGIDAAGLAVYAEALAAGLSQDPTPTADRLRPRLRSGEHR